MNPVEMALQTWRDQKLRYNKQINLVISELSKPLKLIPSPQYQSKLEELKQYLKYSYTYEEDEGFYEIYVHHVAGVVNLSLMELANRIVEALGGPISFWQNKILDLATLVNYHPDISIWEVNRFYQSYMGLSPEFTNFLRKKRSLAKNYLFSLTSLCKIIDKCKASQEDLLKIDQSYKRLKKAEERYYAFMQEMEQAGGNVNELTLSTKGKNNAKNTLFMFLKNKEPKVNTLMKYNFRVGKEESEIQSKLLKGKEYEDLEQLVNSLMKTTKSQRQSIYSDTSQSRLPLESKKQSSVTIEQLRDQFKATLGRAKIGKLQLQEGHHTYIWSKQYFFTYWGFPVKQKPEIDYTQPFRLYEQIVYDIDSQEEFDELNAEDLENDDEMSEESSVSQAGSFVVGDDYRSEQEEEKEDMKGCQAANTRDSWQKQGHELKDYEIICLYTEQNLPLCLQEDLLNFDQKLVEKINGKGRNEIMAIFQAEKKEVSKSRIDSLLKNNFRKIKNKSKQIVYVRNDQTQTAGKVVEVIPLDGFSDPQTTSQNYEISISYASKSKSKKPQYDPNLTILQEPPFSSQ